MDGGDSSDLQAILWDLDGVLVDSTDIHFQSWLMALEGYGISLSRDTFIHYFGQSPDDVTAGILGPNLDPDIRAEIRCRKNTFFDRLVPQVARPMPGAIEWVKNLSGNIPQAVATSASYQQATQMLDIIGLANYFQTVITSSDVRGKPAPDVFLKAAQDLNVKPVHCLVIEDSPSGVEAARNGGMKIIAVCTTNSAESLSNADLILQDLTKLTTNHIKTLFPKAFSNISNLKKIDSKR